VQSEPGDARGVASQAAAFAAVDKSILARKVRVASQTSEVQPIPFPNLRSGPPSEGGSGTQGSSVAGDEIPEVEGSQEKVVSVSHVLTNVLVLQEFLLELAALVQVRAGLFGEVSFV